MFSYCYQNIKSSWTFSSWDYFSVSDHSPLYGCMVPRRPSSISAVSWSSSCLSQVPNQWVQPDLWPMTSTKLFPPHNRSFWYFLFLEPFFWNPGDDCVQKFPWISNQTSCLTIGLVTICGDWKLMGTRYLTTWPVGLHYCGGQFYSDNNLDNSMYRHIFSTN